MFILPEPQCADSEPLVDGNNPIPDYHMTASSDWGAGWNAPMARISAGNGWAASQESVKADVPSFYIQVGVYVCGMLLKTFEDFFIIGNLKNVKYGRIKEASIQNCSNVNCLQIWRVN